MMKALLVALFGVVIFASKAIGAELALSQWKELFKAHLVTDMCHQDWYFRQCFLTSQQQCQISVQSAMRSCVDGDVITMPSIIRSVEQSVALGEKVAECVGKSLEDQMSKFRKPLSECQSLHLWKGATEKH